MKLTLGVLVVETFEAHATNDGISIGQAVDNMIHDCVMDGHVPHSLTIEISEEDKKALAIPEAERRNIAVQDWKPKPAKGGKVDRRV